MWVIVKFLNDNMVAAVLFSWIRTIEETGERLCFWPNKNIEKRRSKVAQGTEDFSDGTFFPCTILMNESKQEKSQFLSKNCALLILPSPSKNFYFFFLLFQPSTCH